jgi:hypothetical protein
MTYIPDIIAHIVWIQYAKKMAIFIIKVNYKEKWDIKISLLISTYLKIGLIELNEDNYREFNYSNPESNCKAHPPGRKHCHC